MASGEAVCREKDRRREIERQTEGERERERENGRGRGRQSAIHTSGQAGRYSGSEIDNIGYGNIPT